MGYDLRITRSLDWSANQGQEISQSEWLELVESDPELSLDPANGPLAASFGDAAFFDWYEGNVLTTDPRVLHGHQDAADRRTALGHRAGRQRRVL
jgi:hypothetical protein